MANLKYDGLLLTSGTIPEDIPFDRQQALLTMTREKVHGQNVRNVGSLTMNDRLLHYTWVHTCCVLRGATSHSWFIKMFSCYGA